MLERLLKTLEDTDLKELVKGGGISFFLRFGGPFLGYVLTLVIANLFEMSDFNDTWAFIFSISIFLSYTFPPATNKLARVDGPNNGGMMSDKRPYKAILPPILCPFSSLGPKELVAKPGTVAIPPA